MGADQPIDDRDRPPIPVVDQTAENAVIPSTQA